MEYTLMEILYSYLHSQDTNKQNINFNLMPVKNVTDETQSNLPRSGFFAPSFYKEVDVCMVINLQLRYQGTK